MGRIGDAFGRVGDWLADVRDRVGARWLLAGGAALSVVVVAVVFLTRSGDEPNEVTESEFNQVEAGMAQASVGELLGEPEREGPHKFKVTEQTAAPSVPIPGSVAPIAPSTTQTTVEEPDCWFYPAGGETAGHVQIGPGETLQMELGEGESQGSEEVVICFDEAQEVSVISGPFGVALEE